MEIRLLKLKDFPAYLSGYLSKRLSQKETLLSLFRMKLPLKVVLVWLVVLCINGSFAKMKQTHSEPLYKQIAKKTGKTLRSDSSGNIRTNCENSQFSFCAPAVSKTSGRRFIAGVITLKETIGTRLSAFRASWENVWPELHVKAMLCYRHNISIRGYGVLSCMYQLLEYATYYDEDYDYLLIMEDDARPHKNATWPTGDKENDLDFMLDEFEKRNGSGLILGGHHVKGYDKTKLFNKVLPKGKGIIKATYARGAYGMMIPRTHLSILREYYSKTLRRKYNTNMATDSEDFHAWRRYGNGGYVAVPLMIDHQSTWSATWGRVNIQSIEGRRDWWRV